MFWKFLTRYSNAINKVSLKIKWSQKLSKISLIIWVFSIPCSCCVIWLNKIRHSESSSISLTLASVRNCGRCRLSNLLSCSFFNGPRRLLISGRSVGWISNWLSKGQFFEILENYHVLDWVKIEHSQTKIYSFLGFLVFFIEL